MTTDSQPLDQECPEQTPADDKAAPDQQVERRGYGTLAGQPLNDDWDTPRTNAEIAGDFSPTDGL